MFPTAAPVRKRASEASGLIESALLEDSLLMILRNNTFEMHHTPAHVRAIRATAHDWIGAYSRLLTAGVTDILIRQIKFASPGAYRMPVRRPNSPAEKFEYRAQR